MTLVALLTDLIFKRFGVQLLDNDSSDRSSVQIKHKLFEDLLEPMEPDEKPYSLNYSTFRYSADRQKRWDEMTNYFVKFLGNILMDVGEVSSQLLGQRVGQPTRNTEEEEDSSSDTEEDDTELL